MARSGSVKDIEYSETGRGNRTIDAIANVAGAFSQLMPGGRPDASRVFNTGVFNTVDVRPWYSPNALTSKAVKFAKPYISPPDVLAGLNALDVDKSKNIRIVARATDIEPNGFHVHVDSWADTILYSGGASWLEISPDSPDCQYGRFSTMDDHPWFQPQAKTSRRIDFAQPFSKPPKVVVFFDQLDMDKDKNWRVATKATDIDTHGFTIHIDAWADTILYSAAAGWVAYREDLKEVFSGTSSTIDVRSWEVPQLKTSKKIDFGGVKFSRTPSVFMAINALDLDHSTNLRLNVSAKSVTKTGMTWHIDSWEDSILYSAGISYICMSS